MMRLAKSIWATTALAGMLGLTACQTSSPYRGDEPAEARATPGFPIQPPAAPVQAAAPPAAPAPAVQAEPAPPPQPLPVVQPPVVIASPPPVIAPPPPPPSPPPPPRYTVTGPVVDADGPARTYVVKQGQGLDAVAREMGTTRAFLAEANDLKEPYRLRPGQRLKGPRTRGKAYVVQSGDTLSAIGRRFNVQASAIAQANDMDTGASIRPGQRLSLPTGYQDRGPTLVTPSPNPPQVAPQVPPLASQPAAPPALRPSATPVLRPSVTPPQPTAVQTPPPVVVAPASPPPRAASLPAAPAGPVSAAIIETAGSPTDAQVRAAGAGKFVWPLRGRILAGFGPRGGAQLNDGINIATSAGASVRAAAGGEVVYAGNELPNYGNLILIRHDDGFITAYGHLSRIMVRIQDRVTQNQEIAEAGQSGGVSQPQLYFQVRYAPRAADRAVAVNPTLVLPQ